VTTKYKAPNGNSTVGRIQLFATSLGGGLYVIKEADGTTLVASTQGPSINAAATALRTRGEALTLAIDLLCQSNDGHMRIHACGDVSQGQAHLMKRTVA
jgi:hypothetical protein